MNYAAFGELRSFQLLCFVDQSAFRESSRGAFLRKAASRSYSPYSVTSMGASASQAGRRTESLVRVQRSPFLKESSVSLPD